MGEGECFSHNITTGTNLGEGTVPPSPWRQFFGAEFPQNFDTFYFFFYF